MQDMWEMWVLFLGREDPLEEEMATHSSIPAWKILWTKEPYGLQSVGSQRIRHDWVTEHNVEFTWWEWIPSASSFYHDSVKERVSVGCPRVPCIPNLLAHLLVGWLWFCFEQCEPTAQVGSLQQARSGWLEFNNIVLIVFILEISSLYGKWYYFFQFKCWYLASFPDIFV